MKAMSDFNIPCIETNIDIFCFCFKTTRKNLCIIKILHQVANIICGTPGGKLHEHRSTSKGLANCLMAVEPI